MSEAALERARIGFIGAGAMATALAGGLARAGVAREALCAADPDPERRDRFAAEVGVAALAENAALVEASDVVVLAVKPGVVAEVLRALSGLDAAVRLRPLWISIAAGVPLARLASALPDGARIVRAMPNTPALVGAGATAFCGNARAGAADRSAARALFASVGTTWEAPEEALLDAVTGLSGSGPAYLFLLVEALAEAGVANGLPEDAARELAVQTAFGAARLARESPRSAAELRRQVTSPGGTTEAALARLEARGFRELIAEAVSAATRRARELAESP